MSRWIFCTVLILLSAGVAFADTSPIRYSSDRGRINLHIRDDYREPIHHTGPEFSDDYQSNPCFPYRCNSRIIGPLRNPTPRAPEDIPVCYYDAEGVLFYAREGRSCSLRYGEK